MAKITTTLRRKQLDQQLSKYKDVPKFTAGYIREIRDALGMSSSQLAARLGITQAGAVLMEQSEIRESISLKTLNRAAEALDCQLVYALVPKTSLAETVVNQARLKAIAQAKGVFRSMGLEQQSTTSEERDHLLNELVQELIRKGGRELWT